MIISFIFHFTIDLFLCRSEARALLRSRGKLKIKDMKVIQYVILHDCRFLCPKKHKKKRVQKIKINATHYNSVPLESGKQRWRTGHWRKKKDWLDRPAKFQPKFGHFQDHGGWVHAKESTTGVLLAFFSSAPGWWRILKLASTKPPWPRSSCKQKGWMTSPSKTALLPPSWWPKPNQNTTLWVCQASVCW